MRPRLLGLVDQLARIYDEPFADVSQLPTLLLAQFTREHVSVALTVRWWRRTFRRLSPLFEGRPSLGTRDRAHGVGAIGKAGSAAAFLPHDALNNMCQSGNRPLASWRQVASLLRLWSGVIHPKMHPGGLSFEVADGCRAGATHVDRLLRGPRTSLEERYAARPDVVRRCDELPSR